MIRSNNETHRPGAYEKLGVVDWSNWLWNWVVRPLYIPTTYVPWGEYDHGL